MGILDWLREKKTQSAASGASDGKAYSERDNLGTRHENFAEASTWWVVNLTKDKGGFAVYTFGKESDAREAMLELDYIHQARDSGKLISTEPIMFGVYRREDGVWETEIVGKPVTRTMWLAACAAFEKHGGKRKGVSDPPPEAPARKTPAIDDGAKVEYVREDRRQAPTGQTMIYKVYKGPSASAAKAFLTKNPVSKPLLYLVVETPEGNFCRDIQGMYQE
jgi:hypothetical protein